MNWKKGFRRSAGITVLALVLFGCGARYDKGFEEGFRDGYCEIDAVCNPPKPFKSSKGYPRPTTISRSDYEEGYKRGKVMGALAGLKEDGKRLDEALEKLRKNTYSN
jgi:hypothetical protein